MDIDPFALELARLSLTLTDIPNPDGWGLSTRDMFTNDVLSEKSKQATIVFANPPFENFSAIEKARYAAQGYGTKYLNKAVEMAFSVLSALPGGGVFGFVLPQSLLHGDNARELRQMIAKNFEIREICLLADKVFAFSDAESALLLGRKKTTTRATVRYKRVRERDVAAFRSRYEVSSSRLVPQSRFRSLETASFRVPELEDAWDYLGRHPSLKEVATLGQGLIFHGQDLPKDAVTFDAKHFKGANQGFVWFDSGLQLHQLPKRYWLNLNEDVIRRPVAGTTVGKSQVLLNYATASRGPWRLKALLDTKGHAVTSRFIAVRPIGSQISVESLWAILNSPIANAFAYSHLGKRDNIVGDMRRIPIPTVIPDGLGLLVGEYFEFASTGAKDEMRRCLLQVDAALLNAYGLPKKLEFELLKLFTGYDRVGVPFKQTNYFPNEIVSPIRFSDFLAFEQQGWEVTNRRRGKLIDQKIEGVLSDVLQDELDSMQVYADYYIEQTTPRPVSHLNALEKRLSLRKGS